MVPPYTDPDPFTRAVEQRELEIFGTGSSPNHKITSAESCRTGLREAGARRMLAERLRAEAMVDLADWIRAADQHLERKEIARLAGVSRTTVYTTLGEQGP